MSKRKSNNPQRRLNRLGKAVLKGCAITFLAGSDGLCKMVEIKTRKPFKAGFSLAKTIESGRYSWSVYCAVFCRDQTGKEYMKSVVINTMDDCRQNDLVETLHHHHLALLEDCNKSHTLNVGWLASPTAHEWTEQDAGAIFSKMNAWNFNAEWEELKAI